MKPGEQAPDFELMDDEGRPRRLSQMLQSGPVVLFFYPYAMTGGCTKESCHFRDLGKEFAALGVQRVGISADSVDKQKQFSAANNFDYPLLSDPERKVATAFGVKRAFKLPNKRVTFVIDHDSKVREVIASELKFEDHADLALEAVRKL